MRPQPLSCPDIHELGHKGNDCLGATNRSRGNVILNAANTKARSRSYTSPRTSRLHRCSGGASPRCVGHSVRCSRARDVDLPRPSFIRPAQTAVRFGPLTTIGAFAA